MKKLLLTIAVAMMNLCGMAQGLYYHPDFYFDKMSPDGKWLATHTMGTLYIYSRVDSTYREYLASDDAVSEYYACGLGNCWSNDGILVGSVNDKDCAYWQNDEWNELPIKADNQGLNLACGITPDGSRIVGHVGISAMNLYSAQMTKPVYWERTEDGSYSEYKELPFPDKDFCGRTPQYVSAISISDDGKTVVGQIVDWSGWYIYPIIYTQDSNGTWNYRTIDEGVLYPQGTVFETWPGEEPVKPNGEQYMNEEELATYLKDYNAYMDAYNRFLNDEIAWEDLPAEPDPANYIVERIDEYKAAMAEYERVLQNYYYELAVFDTKMQEAMYGYSFVFNNVHLAGNGKFYNTTLKYTDITDPLSPKTVYSPARINLSDNDALLTIEGDGSMLASSVMNDGRMVIQTPAYGYGRNSYVVSTDGKSITTFADYITSVNSYVGNWVKEMSTFDVLYVESYDDFGNPTIAIAEDSIVAGSVHCNSEGTVFTSFMYDEWSEGGSFNFVRQFSYQIDFTEDTGIEGIENDTAEGFMYVAGNTLYVSDGITHISLYNMQGGLVMNEAVCSSNVSLLVVPGVYIAKGKLHDRLITCKVVVQ